MVPSERKVEPISFLDADRCRTSEVLVEGGVGFFVDGIDGRPRDGRSGWVFREGGNEGERGDGRGTVVRSVGVELSWG